ncbi:hypothetical protein IFM89_016886 [Coptis chinensis]|uniref:NTF2 domain-containing protein n=1 Tax=Coptis chinensis TaxID=261450 RepID=A0A835I0M0_9MAGN|nr:hypothetical protein IFM89_016886 [Coptis chinensis]
MIMNAADEREWTPIAVEPPEEEKFLGGNGAFEHSEIPRKIRKTSPDLVYRFYQDSSVLSRPGPDGKMASVKTIDDINVVILSMDYKECKAEMKTIDAHDSYKGGVVVQVIGWLIVKDNMKRKFTLSFFLAPQDKGYFGLNDIFRYVDEYETVESDAIAIAVNDVIENVTSTPVTPNPELSHIPEHPMPENTTPEVEMSYRNREVVHELSDNGEVSTIEVEAVEVPVHSGQDKVLPVIEPASTVPEDTPKKSYAYTSIIPKLFVFTCANY